MPSDRKDGEWRHKDGRDWHIGTAAEIEWTDARTKAGRQVPPGVPPVFDAYATLELAGSGNSKALDFEVSEAHGRAVFDVLVAKTPPQPWWLGYLDTGSSEVVFDDAPRAENHIGWGYVLVEAGHEQAWTWRRDEDWKGRLLDMIFPVDRSWLLTTLWDDDWTCLGGPRAFIDSFLGDPELGARTREVDLSTEDPIPPGHIAF
jgi:hypothetical protein